MACYIGLDVSDKSTHLCVVDEAGAIIWRGVCATDPETMARTIARHGQGVARVVLETGALSAFLYHGLLERGVPVMCICARHANGVLSVRSNKSDPHDAEGLAQLARTGWFKVVHIKDSGTHLDRAQLRVREQMVKAHRAMLGQLRGLLKLFGLRLGGRDDAGTACGTPGDTVRSESRAPADPRPARRQPGSARGADCLCHPRVTAARCCRSGLRA
jgi:transposase